jgi:hypothetical protein
MDRNFRKACYGHTLIYLRGVNGVATFRLVAACELLEGGVRALQ